MELVDTRDLKSLDSNIVPVQVRPRVPYNYYEKNWLTATYKIREARRLEYNLQNQEFNYYLPKITIKKTNSNSKKVYLFPGYVFVNTNLENYSALKYTIGIKDIVKFGDNIPFMSDAEIKSMQLVEENSKKSNISKNTNR